MEWSQEYTIVAERFEVKTIEFHLLIKKYNPNSESEKLLSKRVIRIL